MQMVMPTSLQTSFNILETHMEGINHCNISNTKCKPKSIHTISNFIGNWEIFMLMRKQTLIHYISFKFSRILRTLRYKKFLIFSIHQISAV